MWKKITNLPPPIKKLNRKVSLMLEEAFAAAARLNAAGFPVGVQLASRLVPDVTHFLSAYIDNVSHGSMNCCSAVVFVDISEEKTTYFLSEGMLRNLKFEVLGVVSIVHRCLLFAVE